MCICAQQHALTKHHKILVSCYLIGAACAHSLAYYLLHSHISSEHMSDAVGHAFCVAVDESVVGLCDSDAEVCFPPVV